MIEGSKVHLYCIAYVNIILFLVDSQMLTNDEAENVVCTFLFSTVCIKM